MQGAMWLQELLSIPSTTLQLFLKARESTLVKYTWAPRNSTLGSMSWLIAMVFNMLSWGAA